MTASFISAEAKVDPKAAAHLAGHADVKVTWALYQGVTKTIGYGLSTSVMAEGEGFEPSEAR
ncbi:MAG: hypothetical protein AB1609_15230 [Bacillota bacterium]